MSAEHYRLSGRITLRGVLLGFGFGSLTAMVLSVPYAYITTYVPLIYFNVIAAVAFGFLTGMCAAKGARFGGLQSRFAFVLTGAIAGILAEYCGWVAWIFAGSHQKLLVFDPTAILTVADQVLEEGTWGLTSAGNVAGFPLFCVWVAEAGIIVYTSTFAALDGLNKYFCCGKCGAWFTSPTKTLGFAIPADLATVAEHLKRMQFGVLSGLAPLDPATSDSFLSLDLFFCPTCSGFGFFSLRTVALTRTKDGVLSTGQELISKQVIPTENLSDLLKR